MNNHLVLYSGDFQEINRQAEEAGVELEGKKVYIVDIKFITPDCFHPAIWKRNWLFAYDVLTNGDLFNEVYILLINNLDDLTYLRKEQINVIKENAFIFTQ